MHDLAQRLGNSDERGLRVLVVDDDPGILALVTDILTGAGHEVVQADNGVAALQLLESGDIPVVIADWEMPGMSGLDVCRTLRENRTAGYIYVILLSGRSQSEDLICGLSAGADDYMCKPFSPAELLARLRTAARISLLGTRHVTVFAMAKLAESRDPETGQHLERIRSYSWTLARELAAGGRFPEIDDDFLDTIYETSPLHDIGKVGIPDSILLKPGRLTPEEFEIMKTHTTIGAETLGAAVEQHPRVGYFKMAMQIALTHHEKFDGSGYPHGLVGEQIPLCGRIVALADIYDALATARVYKPAFSHDKAMDLILSKRVHFDPYVLSAFEAAEHQFKAIREVFIDVSGSGAGRKVELGPYAQPARR